MKETTNNNNNKNENENNGDIELNTTEEKFQKGLFHYRSFLESVYEATGGETPDLDELYEIIELFSSRSSSSSCKIEGDCSFENISEKLKKLVSRYNHHDAETKGNNDNNSNSNSSDDENNDIESDWNIMIDLLLSNTYFHLGDFSISQFLLSQENEQLKQQQQQDTSLIMDLDHQEEKKYNENPEDLLQKSLKYFPYNASCLSMLANFYRICPSKKPSDTAAIMSLLKDDDDKTTTMKENKIGNNENNNVELICQIYERASTCARKIRCLGLDILADNDDGETQKENNETENEDLMLIKECIELLLLDGAAGVTYVGDDDDEEEEGDDEDDEDEGGETKTTSPPPKKLKVMESNNNKDEEEEKKETEEEEEEYSISQVDATSSFMAGLLNSLIGKHDEALVYLKKFNFSHRLHPNVWKKAIDLGTPSTKEEKDNKKERVLGEQSISSFKPHFEPKSFYNTEQKKADYFTAGVLPDKLYKRMCQVFSPSSNFWKESEYQHRGYFSFFEDIVCNEKKEMEIKHLIDEVVLNHLLPIVQKELSSSEIDDDEKKIVGYEWWCHTRKAGANLGHQMHFDTDESYLAQEKIISHPIVSSVLYLTCPSYEEGGGAGCTIVMDQTPDCTTHATKAYISKPRNNSFMIFPGNLLHGVLPCRPINSGKSNNGISDSSSSSSSGCDSRLTFMVGFWTRSVPEKMKNRKLYGPCSALPNADDATTTEQQAKWVEEIQNGYKSNNTKKDNSNISTKETSTIKARALPTVAPAWEEITTPNNNGNTEELSLSNIPKVLDHRFFVHDASTCFRESLFNDDDDDDNDDDEC